MHWRNEHWGTKWNAIYPSVVTDEARVGRVVYAFQTAWSPPEPWLAEVSRLHPPVDLVHEYVDEMGESAGRAEWTAGLLIEHEQLDPRELEWMSWEDAES